MRLVPVGDDKEWDALLEEQPHRSLYHTTAWLRFQAEHFGFDLRRLVIYHEHRPVGLFPLFLTRRAIFRVSSSPRGVDYLNLGPLVKPELLPELFDCYEHWVRHNKVDHTSIAFTSEIDSRVAVKYGYRCERHLICTVDLQAGETSLWQGLKSSCRKRIRKAKRMGVKIIEGDLTPYLNKYVELSAQVFGKSGKKPVVSRFVLSGMLSALAESGHLLSFRADLKGKVIGMMIAGHYGKTLYSLDTVSDYAFREYPASNLMMWHLMSWGCRHGIEKCDFGGARISGIARFKLGLGGTIVPYTNITKAHSFLARSADRLGRWMRR